MADHDQSVALDDLYSDADLGRLKSEYDPPPRPLDNDRDWKEASVLLHQRVLALSPRLRGGKGQVYLINGSPATGKTRVMLSLAHELQAREQVLWSCGTAELAQEVFERVRAMPENTSIPIARVAHVILGRREDNCKEMVAVERAQALGYSPASTVCMACPYHPDAGNIPCEYYAAQMRASRAIRQAKKQKLRLPLIITTYECATAHAPTETHGKYGALWKAQHYFFDEDPSRALREQFKIDTEKTLTYGFDNAPPNVQSFIKILHHARGVAEEARERALLTGFDEVHQHGTYSSYTSTHLHGLLTTSAAAHNLDLRHILTQVSQWTPEIEAGALLHPNKLYPNAKLAVLAASLKKEAEALDVSTEGICYAVRLEKRGSKYPWRYVHDAVQNTVPKSANVIVGDAYGETDILDRLFNAKSEGITVAARFPANVKIRRSLVNATKNSLRPELIGDFFETELRVLLDNEAGRKVLFYTNKALRAPLQQWMEKNFDRFRLDDVAYDHYWSGRGKDRYRYFDTMMLIGEPIPNPHGVIDEANALYRYERKLDIGRQRWFYTKDKRLERLYRIKSTQELAQAMHRIRPLIPVDTEKRIFLFGHYLKMPAEILDNLIVEKTTDGEKQYVEGVLQLASAAAITERIVRIFEATRCWSPIFAYTVLDDEPAANPLSEPQDLVPAPQENFQRINRWVTKQRAFQEGQRAAIRQLGNLRADGVKVPWGARPVHVYGSVTAFDQLLVNFAPPHV